MRMIDTCCIILEPMQPMAIDPRVLRALLTPEIKIVPGRAMMARVVVADGNGRGSLSIAGYLLEAELPKDVRTGDDLRLVVRDVSPDRVLLGIADQHQEPAAAAANAPPIPIAAPVALEKLLAAWPRERRLYFCDEGGDARPLASVAQPGSAAILTGPEGGFDPAERALLRSQAFVVPVTLGPRILRADTAALAALALWQSVAGDWR